MNGREDATVGKILVTGASGHLGRKTLEHLLKHKPANQLVGLVRDPSKAEDLVTRGIEIRQADYLDPTSLTRAFVDVEKLMLTATHAFTDRNTAHANVIDAAVKAGMQHLVFMPIMRKQGSIFKMKEITEEDIFTEQKILSSGLTYTFAKHPPFLDNISFYIGKKVQETGVIVPAGTGKFTAATRDDLAAGHAAILAGTGHENKSYCLTAGPAISFADIATILSGVQGTKVAYTPVSNEEYVKIKLAEGWPDFVVEFARKWVEGMNAGEWDEPSSDLEALIGHKPKSPTEFFSHDYVDQ
jgi:NAD(P)H dehydrogenase (quinone)